MGRDHRRGDLRAGLEAKMAGPKSTPSMISEGAGVARATSSATAVGSSIVTTVGTAGRPLNSRLSHDHYAAIGGVAAFWAKFERAIDSWLIAFAEVDHPIGVCLTSQIMGSRAKLDALIALLKHLGAGKKWYAQLDALASDTVALSEKRNRAVHDVWDLRKPSEPIRKEQSAKRALRHLRVHVPTQKLRDLVHKIAALERRLDHLCIDIMVELPPSPGKRPKDRAP